MLVRSRIATSTAAAATAVLAGSVAALAAGTPTPDAPPRIAFVADAFVPADALAVGPIAGQLGAPVFTTSASGLSDAAADGLDAYDPQLVIVAGGPGALPDAILDEIRTATGLTGDAVDRVFGAGRTETAASLASLLEDRGLDPAFLPVEATATDADLLDGMDATEFAPAGDYLTRDDAIDADTLGGQDAAEFAPAGDYLTQSDRGRFAPAGATQVYEGSSPLVDNEVETLIELEVDATDECGDGTTRHEYLVHYSGNVRILLGADPGDVSYAGAQILMPSESINVSFHNGLPKAVENFVKPPTGSMAGPIQLTRLLDDVTPGSTMVRVDFENTTSAEMDVVHNDLIVQHLGWTCG